ncbi:MAG: beta-lactamase family protein, partial [Clostridia bacterium]|nr:beta-lactamase family protein [Clostridia bacterium]
MMNEHLLRGILYFTRETRIMDGMAAVCGREDFRAAACDGREIREKTLFDLASVTKLFTGITLMRLIETGTLDPQRRITDYCPAFSGLRSLTVEQAMGFQRLIQTPERIDEQESRENALAILREARDAGPTGPRAYSDIPAMILRYVIEAAAEMPMYACIKKLILEPADMRETWAGVPEDRKKDCLIYGPEYRIEGEKKIRREAPVRGI